MTYPWYKQTPQDIAARFDSNVSFGLTRLEAQTRLEEHGLNALTQEKRTSPFKIFLQQFNSMVIWVLLGAVVVSFALSEHVDGIAILAIVIMNAIIGFVLEYRSDRAILALQQLAAPKATVFRDGYSIVIPASEVVPGDIILLERGDLVAADARLVDAASLQTNEASLTGESQPVEKNTLFLSVDTQLGDQKNMVFMGTAIVNGTARAIVVGTGMKTEMGHIAKMLDEASRDETPLQKRLNQVGKRLLLVCFSIVL